MLDGQTKVEMLSAIIPNKMTQCRHDCLVLVRYGSHFFFAHSRERMRGIGYK